MGVVQSLTAARMLAIEAASVVAGAVVGDNLWLTRQDGSSFDAGVVRGASQLPNKVLNSRFRVNQRATGTISLSNGIRAFGPDCWAAVANGQGGYVPAAFSVVVAPPGVLPESDTNYMRLDTSLIRAAAGAAYAYVNQYIENAATLSGKTATLSFWARCNTNDNQMIVPSLMQYFGTGGSTSVVITLDPIEISRDWFRYTVTFSLPSISGKTVTPGSNLLELRFMVAGESNPIGLQKDIFDFWGVQLEEGGEATSLRMNTYASDLAACQRYYWRVAVTQDAPYYLWVAKAISTTAAQAWVPFPVPMRKPPAVTFSALAPARNDGDILRDFTSITVMNNAAAGQDVPGISIRGNGSSGPTNLVVGDANLMVLNTTGGFVDFSAEF
jgi:hypothetical protein